MKRVSMALSFLVAASMLAGCGGNKGGAPSSGGTSGSARSASTPPPAAEAPSGGGSATSSYDQGPRASDTPVNAALATEGEKLFTSKGCSACHGFGKKVSCPDQMGVPKQRTAQWMEQQILHPEVMTKQDPIAKQLFAQYKLQMPNQGVTPDQAKAIVEYIKKKNQ